MKKIKVLDINFHRNGVSGTGFHAVLFSESPNAGRKVGVVFPVRGAVAVLDVALLAGGGGVSDENRWRGDDYEADLREAVLGYETRRSGLSALPVEEQSDLLYGKHACVLFRREGGLIAPEEKYGTCAVCGGPG